MHALALAAVVLRIVVWPGGLDGASHAAVLRCAPAGGTVARPAAACLRLAALPAPFAPVPPGTMCSDIYSGPQVARVTGRYRGRAVWATFRRRNGCETARWDRLAFLFR